MTNKIGSGKQVMYTNTSTLISAGDVVLMNDIVGVAVDDIAATTGTGPVEIEGEFTLPASAGAWLQGEDLYWHAAGTFNTTASGGTLCAVAGAGGKTTAATTGPVILNKHS